MLMNGICHPEPKWMRWRTYNRYVERFDEYNVILNEGVEELWAELCGAGGVLADE